MTLRPLALLGLILLITAPAAHAASKTTANKLLTTLTVADETTSPAYSRDKFKLWTTTNGCTTRQAVLRRQNTAATRTSCKAKSGSWTSPYDGLSFTLASKLDIDHLVPLGDAWRSGASGWDTDTRTAYANDVTYPRSLIAVSAHANRSKSDSDPSDWLPTKVAYRCTYAVSWIAVKYRWQLAVDTAEKNALLRLLKTCAAPVRTLATPPKATIVMNTTDDDGTDPAPANPAPATPTPPATTPAPALSGDADGIDPRFSTCAAAKSAGYGPYYRGVNTEYNWYRDADSDGIVCE